MPVQSNRPTEVSQYRWEHNHLLLRVSCTDGPGPGNLRRPSFSWSCKLLIGRLLSEDAKMRLAIWAWSTCLISCMTGSSGLAWLLRQNTLRNATHVLHSKPGSPKPPLKHCGHTFSGADPPQLSMPVTWERPGWECSGGHRPFHQVFPGICNQDPNHPNNC